MSGQFYGDRNKVVFANSPATAALSEFLRARFTGAPAGELQRLKMAAAPPSRARTFQSSVQPVAQSPAQIRLARIEETRALIDPIVNEISWAAWRDRAFEM